MKRHRLTSRIWVTMAFIAASLVSASSAAAVRNAADGAGALAPQAPVSNTPQGFDWTNLTIAVAVVIVVAIAAYTVSHVVRNRSRLAPSH